MLRPIGCDGNGCGADEGRWEHSQDCLDAQGPVLDAAAQAFAEDGFPATVYALWERPELGGAA